MKLAKILIAFGLGLVFALTVYIKIAQADGGIFYPPEYYSAETTQKAFIYFANQTENLVVLTTFQGSAKDFVWVIPTPTKPEINKGGVALFNNLTEITKTTETGPDTVYNKTNTWGLGGSTATAPVEVISEKTVDVYNTAVLKATDENALAKWLTDNGYSFPEDKSQNLKSYVDNGWYFVAAKIKPDLISGGGIVNQIAEGTLTPLRLTFQTDKIIYPMKLTGLALTQTVSAAVKLLPDGSSMESQPVGASGIPITLYILSNQRSEQKLLTTKWANWIGKESIKKLNDNLGASVISGDKLFLTKMSDTVMVKDISDDFVITSATDNNIYPTPTYKTAGFWLMNLIFLILVPIILVFFPIPLGLIFILFLLFQIYLKKEWVYIIGSIYQIFTCLILLLVALVVVAANGFDLGGLWLQNGFIGGFIAYLAIVIVAIYLTIKMLLRYKKTFPRI